MCTHLFPCVLKYICTLKTHQCIYTYAYRCMPACMKISQTSRATDMESQSSQSIQRLSGSDVRRINAGQLIADGRSVVRELVENAIGKLKIALNIIICMRKLWNFLLISFSRATHTNIPLIDAGATSISITISQNMDKIEVLAHERIHTRAHERIHTRAHTHNTHALLRYKIMARE